MRLLLLPLPDASRDGPGETWVGFGISEGGSVSVGVVSGRGCVSGEVLGEVLGGVLGDYNMTYLVETHQVPSMMNCCMYLPGTVYATWYTGGVGSPG